MEEVQGKLDMPVRWTVLSIDQWKWKKPKVPLCKSALFHLSTLAQIPIVPLMCLLLFVICLKDLWINSKLGRVSRCSAGKFPVPRLSTLTASKAPRWPYSLPSPGPRIGKVEPVQKAASPGPRQAALAATLPLSKHDGRATRQDPL